MSTTIKFDAKALSAHDGSHLLNTILLDNIVMRPSAFDVFSNTMVGQNLHVALTLIDPEPAAFAPPWDDAPDWAEWAAQDWDGRSRWYGTKPKPDVRCASWISSYRSFAIERGEVTPNWENTLQHRPEPPEPELNPCPRCGGKMREDSCGLYSWWLKCGQCGNSSPVRSRRKGAIEAHNARRLLELDPCLYCGDEWIHRVRKASKEHYGICGGCGKYTLDFATKWELAADVNRRPA